MAVEANWETQNKMSQSRHAISKSGSTPLGLFVKLPQEIRDMIYEPVLSAGHTSITRASKALSQDTKVALSQYGIFRVCIAHDDRNVITRFALHPQLQGARLHDIRNLDLSYKPARFGATFPSADWIEGTLADLLHDLKFVIGDPGRCNFRLDMQGYEFSDREETAAFPLLRGFKHVRVELIFWYTMSLSDKFFHLAQGYEQRSAIKALMKSYFKSSENKEREEEASFEIAFQE